MKIIALIIAGLILCSIGIIDLIVCSIAAPIADTYIFCVDRVKKLGYGLLDFANETEIVRRK